MKNPQLPASAVFQTHGRKRGHEETHGIEIISDPEKCMELGWIGVRQMYRIKRVKIHRRTGEITEETAYGITSLSAEQANAEEILDLAREHWDVENQLHRTLDVMFHEDGCQVRLRNAATNLAILRQMALNMIKAIPASPTGSTKIKSRRMACAIEEGFLIKTLKGKGMALNA